GGAEDHRPVLDHLDPPRARVPRLAEAPLMLLDAFRKNRAAPSTPPATSSRAPSGNRHVAPTAAKGRAAPAAATTPAASGGGGLAGLVRSSPDGPVDSVLAAIVLALIGFGVVMVYSSSAIEATVRFKDP